MLHSTNLAFGKPESPSLDGATQSSINVSWAEPAADGGANQIQKYLISCSPDCENARFQGTSAIIDHLVSNSKYLITIAAVGSDERTGAASKVLPGITGNSKIFNCVS